MTNTQISLIGTFAAIVSFILLGVINTNIIQGKEISDLKIQVDVLRAETQTIKTYRVAQVTLNNRLITAVNNQANVLGQIIKK